MSDEWSAKEIYADLKVDMVHRFDKLDSSINELDRKVDGKADRVDLVRFESAVQTAFDEHGKRLTDLEADVAEVKHARTFSRKVWAVVGSVSGIAAIIAGALIGAHFH